MLFRHSSFYLLARGLPGLINFLAIAVYTRLLPPDEYGRYALVIAGVGFCNVLLFQWLRLALLRFLPVHEDDKSPLLSVIALSFILLNVFSGAVGLGLVWQWAAPAWKSLILLAIPLLWMQAWFEINLELFRSQLAPLRYGAAALLKAAVALGVGTLCVLSGLGAHGPLLGLLGGMALALVLWTRNQWRGISLRVSRPLTMELLRYGLPLAMTAALIFIVSASDRFIIAWLLDEAAAGSYAAAYDLAEQPLILLMMIVNLAAYPLAVRALEQQGREAARQQLRENGVLLLFLALPATVGIVLLAPGIVQILGVGFRATGTAVLPWVATAALLSGVRAYYLDLAFQLGKYTAGQVWVVAAASLVNIALNLWWIPVFGAVGAAYATLVAYLAAFCLSWAIGRRAFPIPIPYGEILKIGVACLVMAVSLRAFSPTVGLATLPWQILIGGFAYGVMSLILNIGGYRKTILAKIS